MTRVLSYFLYKQNIQCTTARLVKSIVLKSYNHCRLLEKNILSDIIELNSKNGTKQN